MATLPGEAASLWNRPAGLGQSWNCARQPERSGTTAYAEPRPTRSSAGHDGRLLDLFDFLAPKISRLLPQGHIVPLRAKIAPTEGVGCKPMLGR